MRFVALALILLSLPLFVALLKRYPARRDTALYAVGLLIFTIGFLQLDAAFISWAMWPGIARGMMIAPIDTLCWALLLTRRERVGPVPMLWLLILYLVPPTLSIAVSAVPMASVFVPWQTLRLILIFLAIAGEIHRMPALLALFRGLAVGLIVQAGFVIEQKLSGAVQAGGTAAHQNVLGLVVELSIVPLLAAVLEGHRSKLLYAGILAGLIAIAGSGSRGAMAVAPAGVILVFLISMIRRPTAHKGKLLGAAGLAAAVIVPLGLATLEDRFGDRSVITYEQEREAFSRAARAMANDHPLGVGANTYVTVSNTQGYAERAGVIWSAGSRSAPVHNVYLLARAETGWFGNIVVLMVLVIPLLLGFRAAFADRKSPLGGITVGASVAVLMALIHNNYEYAWVLEEVQRFYFLNLAIIAACIMANRRNRREARRARAARRSELQAAAQ
ncbi:O-antigen ligase family protein [Qipengyuania sediminis]|uniref:O-antigen ligase family protein n=1 Tax=Qipengyuania sediminis TaxID=1532023 RepID=UPI0010597CF2|nr:O-antigen ligase family protein [Qipengyuania sediminis]